MRIMREVSLGKQLRRLGAALLVCSGVGMAITACYVNNVLAAASGVLLLSFFRSDVEIRRMADAAVRGGRTPHRATCDHPRHAYRLSQLNVFFAVIGLIGFGILSPGAFQALWLRETYPEGHRDYYIISGQYVAILLLFALLWSFVYVVLGSMVINRLQNYELLTGAAISSVRGPVGSVRIVGIANMPAVPVMMLGYPESRIL